MLVWRFPQPCRTISSAFVGGGTGRRQWIVNAQVTLDYERTDIDEHVREIATEHGCHGEGIGMLTAAKVERFTSAEDRDVHAYATVGVSSPTWAADADDAISPYRPGTINVVVFAPHAFDDGAFVNAVMTATEAKTQALVEAAVPGTGTASDAVVIVSTAPSDVARERFAGPRSTAGASIGRAVHAAVHAGLARAT